MNFFKAIAQALGIYPPPVPKGSYGSPMLGVTAHPYDLTPDKVDAAFGKAKDLGFAFVRTDYDPQAAYIYPAILAAAKKYGMGLALITPYVRVAGKRDPGYQSVDTFDAAAYAAQLIPIVQAFAGIGCTWEIYNEPNASNAQGQLTQAQWYQMLAAVAPAIRANDPTATVLTGGISGLNDSWIACADAAVVNAKTADGKPAIDGIGVHPYDVKAPQDIGRALSQHAGRHRPLYVTEWGNVPVDELSTALNGLNGWTPLFCFYQLAMYK